MKFLSEKNIELKFKNKAISLGWQTLKLDGKNKRGMPDRLFFKDGVVFFVEFKSTKGRLRLIQKEMLKNILKNDLPCFVVRDDSSIELILNDNGNEKNKLFELSKKLSERLFNEEKM